LLLGSIVMLAQRQTFAATVCGLAWQPDSLWTLTPVLEANATPEQLVAGVLDGAVASLRADAVALSLYDPRCRRYRVIAVATADDRRAPWLALACDVPPGFPSSRGDATDLLVLPEDDRDGPLARRLAEVESTAAYVALAHAGEVIGTLHVARPAPLPFTLRERDLVRTTAEHAIAALTAVRLL